MSIKLVKQDDFNHQIAQLLEQTMCDRGIVNNFDTVRDEGMYISSSSNMAGAPYAGNCFGKLLVFKRKHTTASQIWLWQIFMNTAGKNYIRTNINDEGWTDWDTLPLGSDLNALVDTHKAEAVSQCLNLTRDLSILGKQTITTFANREIKSIVFFGSVDGTAMQCMGMYGKSGGFKTQYVDGTDYKCGYGVNIIFSKNSKANRIGGAVTVNIGNIEIDWAVLTGASVTGTAYMNFLIQYHG